MPNFPKIEHFLHLDTHMHVCVSGGKNCSLFGKFGVQNTRFEIHPVTLLPTTCSTHNIFNSEMNILQLMHSLKLKNKIRETCDNGLSSCGVYLGFKKVFDRANYKILLSKLLRNWKNC